MRANPNHRREVLEEVFRRIPEFPNYEISNLGNVYNVRRRQIMRTSINNYGHVKISLVSQYTGIRHTRSVARLVAEAFVKRPTFLCDQVMVLDGDFTNLASTNLTWRPEWFVWRYTHQLKTPQPIHYKNLSVANITTGDVYDSIVDAGVSEGMLFEEIWESTYTGKSVFPYRFVYQIVE